MAWWASLITLTRKLAKERVHWPELRSERLDRGRPEQAPLTQEPAARLPLIGTMANLLHLVQPRRVPPHRSGQLLLTGPDAAGAVSKTCR